MAKEAEAQEEAGGIEIEGTRQSLESTEEAE
jgi:hypothetical protein